MRHLKSGKKLNRTASHRKATLQSLASNLFEHKRIRTTTAKAKALRPYAEKLITKAKNAINNEQNGNLPEGHSIDIHSRRIVARELKRKEVLQELFDSIAPVVAERDGGFTRIVKLGARRGDSAEVAIIELVDWSNPQETGKSKTKAKKKSTPKLAPAVAETTEEVKVEAEEVAETTEEVKAEAEEVAETTEEVKAEAKEVAETTEEVKAEVEEVAETTEEAKAEDESEETENKKDEESDTKESKKD